MNPQASPGPRWSSTRRPCLLLAIILVLLPNAGCQRPATTLPQFSTEQPGKVNAPGKSIVELLSDETTTTLTPAISTTSSGALITTHATTTVLTNNGTTTRNNSALGGEVTETEGATEDPGSVLVTGYISTTREEYEPDRVLESTSLQHPSNRNNNNNNNNHQHSVNSGGGGGGLLFDPVGDEGLMTRDGPMDPDGHRYHVPAKCHTYIPDHLAGDDDYRKWGGVAGSIYTYT